MELSFERQILEAAKSIAAATGAFIKAASAVQKELIEEGKMSARYSRLQMDETDEWSEGLVSAVSGF